MTFLKITLPIYKADKWDRLEKDGKIEVSSDVDSLSDGYEMLKQQIDKLLSELDAQNRLAENSQTLERQIMNQAHTLKILTQDIELATQHYESLKLFLQNMGIDPSTSRLTFDKKFLLKAASVSQVEIVPPDPRYPDGVM
jgi:hypothetical protein